MSFAQPTTQHPVPALQDKAIGNIQAKQSEILNKVQGRLNPFWILLDNQSRTVSVFYNNILVQNIRKVEKDLHLYTNVGMSTIDEVENLPGFGTVWLHREGIMNILSLQHLVNPRGSR